MNDKKNTKKYIIVLLVLLLIIIAGVITGVFLYREKLRKDQLELERRIRLNRTINVEVYEETTIKEMFSAEPIEIIYEDKIDNKSIGRKKINIKYKDSKRKYKSHVYVNVVDTTPPVIFSKASYKLYKGKNIDFVNEILCGDNYDDKPIRKIIGEYDIGKVGNYKVKYYAEDSRGNSNEKEFTIKVVEKPNNSGGSTSSSPKLNDFNEVLKTYKNNNTEVGIDVSKWQNEIDFEKVKDAGAEFVIMRLGIQNGIGGELTLDNYFKKNIEEATKAGLKIGVYLYTYASSKSDALNQAKWVIENLGNYKVDLGVSYDWESWKNFNKINLSFYKFTEVADTFLDYIKNNGYNAMLYGSKYYLENVWQEKNHDVWLAQYTSKTNYSGKYRVWQIMSTGKIDGISGAVDIDILYK